MKEIQEWGFLYFLVVGQMGISPLRTFDSFHQTNFEYILYTASSIYGYSLH